MQESRNASGRFCDSSWPLDRASAFYLACKAALGNSAEFAKVTGRSGHGRVFDAVRVEG